MYDNSYKYNKIQPSSNSFFKNFQIFQFAFILSYVGNIMKVNKKKGP